MARSMNVFPNMSVLASYNNLSNIICYEDISRDDFNEVQKNPFSLSNAKKTSIIVHETCHYIDHISTLSGQILLRKIYAAYNSLVAQKEKDFHHIITLFNALRSMKYEDYYKTINLTSVGKNILDWSFETSIGAKYDNNGFINEKQPIIFNRFKYKGELVARIPFSVEALWETNAMAEEMKSQMQVLQLIEDTGEKAVQMSIYQRQHLNYLYTPELLTYSSPAHLVSSLLKVQDIYLAFLIAKSISSISLNLPLKYYNQIKMPRNLSAPKSRKVGLVSSGDPSNIFYIIVLNLLESKMKFSSYKDIDTEKILSISGLPQKKILENEIRREISLQRRILGEGTLSSWFFQLNDAGQALFDAIGIDSSLTDSRVYVEFSSACLVLCGEEMLDDTNKYVQRSNSTDKLLRDIKSFVSACGY